MINKTEYAWEDIQIVVQGKNVPLTNVTAVEYTKKRKHENLMGSGSEPVGMGRGNAEYEASITMRLSEVLDLQAAWGGDITKKVFNVTVAYAQEAGVPTVDILTYCRINEIKKGLKQGDTSMEVELPLTIGGIQSNV